LTLEGGKPVNSDDQGSSCSTNARYWHRRADRMEHIEDEPRAELAAIQGE